jgi:hypothetical protein
MTSDYPPALYDLSDRDRAQNASDFGASIVDQLLVPVVRSAEVLVDEENASLRKLVPLAAQAG